MKLPLPIRCQLIVAILLFCAQVAEAQFMMDMIDTTKDVGKGLLSIYRRFDRVHISGYLQPQFQAAPRGAPSYSGGDFGEHENNRFMIRRGRIRFDYDRFNKDHKPSLQLVLQFDGTERGVNIRDFWGRYYENKWEALMITAGMFARPFGYEVNLSSAERESPERGRMSQILMKTERDLGAMVSFEPRKKGHPLRQFKLDLGLFNGQGLTAPGEYDSYKDIIGRLSLKPLTVVKGVDISAGISLLEGGLIQNTQYIYHTAGSGNAKFFRVDSSLNNLFAKAPRKYRGADLQVRIKNKWGYTIIRGEYWRGTQTSTGYSTETPGLLLNQPYYIRKFDGAFFYFLQNIINQQHQVGIKYDWYDPNTEVDGRDIGSNNIGPADVKYQTWSFGYNYYIDDNFKLMIWYDRVINEKTILPDFAEDADDDVFTCRLQFNF